MNEKQPEHNPNEEVPAHSEARPGSETEPQPRPRIYVASLADYNNGRLHGVWLDAARESEALHADIQTMLSRSRQPDAEEFAIFDQDDFGICQIHEYDPIEQVARIARGIREHGYAFAAWADVNEGSLERLDDFSAAYLGHYDSLAAYAESIIADLGYENELDRVVPEALRPYVKIDDNLLGRDMLFNGDINLVVAPDGGVWVFDARV